MTSYTIPRRPSRAGSARRARDRATSYLDPGSGGPENGNQRFEWDAGCRYDFENPDYR